MCTLDRVVISLLLQLIKRTVEMILDDFLEKEKSNIRGESLTMLEGDFFIYLFLFFFFPRMKNQH